MYVKPHIFSNKTGALVRKPFATKMMLKFSTMTCRVKINPVALRKYSKG